MKDYELPEGMQQEDTMEVRVLGRNIGRASGWDQITDSTLWFYDYEPSAEYADKLDAFRGGIAFDYEAGELYGEDEGVKVDVIGVFN